jgi:pimeloyl-ACP methyl ester carboxylesterase
MSRRRWPRRLLLVLVAGFCLAVVFSTWFSHRLLVEVLTGRAFAPPVEAITDPLAQGYRGDPEKAFGLAFETLSIDTPGGPAPAWLIPPAAGFAAGSTAAIFVHGIGGAREDGYPYLRALHAAGLPVLLITYRNDAEAPSAPEGLRLFGLTEWEDLDAAVTFMQGHGAGRFVLVGASMGGGIVGQFLARSPRAGTVSALILDAPALDAPMVLAHITDRLKLPLRSLGAKLAIPAFALTHGANLAQAAVIPVVAEFDGPVLLFHGAADRIVPPAISFAVLAERGGGTMLLHTAGDHLQSHLAEPERFDRILRGFLADLPR